MKQSNPTNHKPNPTTTATPGAPLFSLGKVLSTPGALDAVTEVHGERWRTAVQKLLARHLRCERGELTEADHEANLAAISGGTRVFSAFRLASLVPGKPGTKVWIITEADRSSTTLLLPDEY